MTQRKFDFSHFSKLTKRRYKKKFKKPIKTREIKKIINDFIQYGILEKMIEGGPVKIDKFSTIEIVGTPVLDDKKFFKLLMKGKYISRRGSVKSAELNSRRKDIKYSIVYKNSLNQEILFQADPKLSKAVHEAIVHKNHYYRICEN